MVNRSAVVVRIREPYVEWSKTLDDGDVVAEIGGPGSLYLLPEDIYDNPDAHLLKHFHGVFEEELFAWCTDPRMWPPVRTWKMFQAWFAVEFYASIHDLGRGAIVDDEAELAERAAAVKTLWSAAAMLPLLLGCPGGGKAAAWLPHSKGLQPNHDVIRILILGLRLPVAILVIRTDGPDADAISISSVA